MAEIKTDNGRPVVDYMARDYDSLLQSMRAMIPYKLPEWRDFESELDFGNVLLQLFAHMGDILSYYQDRIANESFLGTARTRRSIIQHLRLIGYQLGTAAPAAASLTMTVPGSCNDTVTISRGDAFATKSSKSSSSVRFEYNSESPLTIEWGKVSATEGRKYFEGIPVEEGRLIRDEIVGESDGTANQRFVLAHAGLILRAQGQESVTKDIILSTGPGEEWTLQESLAFSREGQMDFVIEIDEHDRATIIFGDGVFGAIPVALSQIRATYRVGGGPAGNVPRDSITTIVEAPQLALIGAQVSNPEPATGGAERESIEHAVGLAPAVFRSRKRAVTRDDCEALARDFKGVGKVRARAGNWNTVKLYVAPEGGGHVSDVLEANLLAYFEDKRPVSTIIQVEDVDYVRIYITAEVGVESYFHEQDIEVEIQEAVGTYLAFDQVDFGKTVYLSKLYEKIEDIRGVAYVNINEFRSEHMPAGHIESAGMIKLNESQIPIIPNDPDDDTEYLGGARVIFKREAAS
jgi:uncharacterized phage protein gp47/JayE